MASRTLAAGRSSPWTGGLAAGERLAAEASENVRRDVAFAENMRALKLASSKRKEAAARLAAATSSTNAATRWRRRAGLAAKPKKKKPMPKPESEPAAAHACAHVASGAAEAVIPATKSQRALCLECATLRATRSTNMGTCDDCGEPVCTTSLHLGIASGGFAANVCTLCAPKWAKQYSDAQAPEAKSSDESDNAYGDDAYDTQPSKLAVSALVAMLDLRDADTERAANARWRRIASGARPTNKQRRKLEKEEMTKRREAQKAMRKLNARPRVRVPGQARASVACLADAKALMAPPNVNMRLIDLRRPMRADLMRPPAPLREAIYVEPVADFMMKQQEFTTSAIEEDEEEQVLQQEEVAQVPTLPNAQDGTLRRRLGFTGVLESRSTKEEEEEDDDEYDDDDDDDDDDLPLAANFDAAYNPDETVRRRLGFTGVPRSSSDKENGNDGLTPAGSKSPSSDSLASLQMRVRALEASLEDEDTAAAPSPPPSSPPLEPPQRLPPLSSISPRDDGKLDPLEPPRAPPTPPWARPSPPGSPSPPSLGSLTPVSSTSCSDDHGDDDDDDGSGDVQQTRSEPCFPAESSTSSNAAAGVRPRSLPGAVKETWGSITDDPEEIFVLKNEFDERYRRWNVRTTTLHKYREGGTPTRAVTHAGVASQLPPIERRARQSANRRAERLVSTDSTYMLPTWPSTPSSESEISLSNVSHRTTSETEEVHMLPPSVLFSQPQQRTAPVPRLLEELGVSTSQMPVEPSVETKIVSTSSVLNAWPSLHAFVIAPAEASLPWLAAAEARASRDRAINNWRKAYRLARVYARSSEHQKERLAGDIEAIRRRVDRVLAGDAAKPRAVPLGLVTRRAAEDYDPMMAAELGANVSPRRKQRVLAAHVKLRKVQLRRDAAVAGGANALAAASSAVSSAIKGIAARRVPPPLPETPAWARPAVVWSERHLQLENKVKEEAADKDEALFFRAADGSVQGGGGALPPTAGRLHRTWEAHMRLRGASLS
ncbi:hypothetical protein NFJ02_26g60280 [Pycnococcus provasolii]